MRRSSASRLQAECRPSARLRLTSLFFSIFTVLSATGYLLFVPPATDAITLEEALNAAQAHSHDLRITEQSAHITRADARGETAFIFPHASADAGYLGYDSTAASFPGFEHPAQIKSASLQASQLLWAGGRIWQGLELKERINSKAGLDERLGARAVRADVKKAFHSALLHESIIEILAERVEQKKEELLDAQDLLAAGMVTSLDVRRAQQALNSSRERLAGGQTAHHDALIGFNLSMGRSADDELLRPDGALSRAHRLQTSLQHLTERFSQGDLLDLMIVRNEVTISQLRHRMARAGHIPELSVVASAETANQTTGDMEESYAAGLKLTWNIFDGGLIRSRSAAALAGLGIAEEREDKTSKLIGGAIETIRFSAATLAERISLQEENVELARLNYEDARGQYRAGMITITELGLMGLALAESRFSLSQLYFDENILLIQAESLLE